MLHVDETRVREAWQVLRDDGPRRLAQHVSRVAYMRLGASRLDFPLELNDIADSKGLTLAEPPRRPARGAPLTVGWICSPPAPGSGGHTTLFRMVEAAEAAGHTCVLYLYGHGQLSRHERVIRQCWPALKAEVRSVASGVEALDAFVASGWPTAHVLAARAELPTRRLYLIQDFEPFFYPYGSEYVLAEDTYRFGFKCITIGHMVANLLHERFGVRAHVTEHGCDTSVYKLINPAQRGGVVFYAKPGVGRRGFELGMLALQEFHQRQPEQEIHIFGDASVRVPFPVINHGTISPLQLSKLYNQCRAGIVMSFTNLSLVPAEMLACGTIPAIMGPDNARVDLENEFARWVDPSPRGLANELCAIVNDAEPSPEKVAASIRGTSWASTQRSVVQAIEAEVYGPVDE